ncbi:hypothetical protein FGG08_002042, partial [Glutinoglossum americanum]
ISGITITAALIHLPLQAHAHIRADQSLILRQQSATLNALARPKDPHHYAPGPRSTEPRSDRRRKDVLEDAKERWNAEVVGAVRRVQAVDWRGVRERLEEGVGGLWGRR